MANREVNDAPSFNVGSDRTVISILGAQSIAGWVAGTTPGADGRICTPGPLHDTARRRRRRNTLLHTDAPCERNRERRCRHEHAKDVHAHDHLAVDATGDLTSLMARRRS